MNNPYLTALKTIALVGLIVGGVISIFAASRLSDYDPGGAVAFFAFGSSLAGFGLLVLVFWLTAAAIVRGNGSR